MTLFSSRADCSRRVLVFEALKTSWLHQDNDIKMANLVKGNFKSTRAVFSEQNLFSAKFPLVGKYSARM
jgi:hypothetical protein